MRETNPEKKAKLKKQLKGLMQVSIIMKMDLYESLERPIRKSWSLENLDMYFAKEFLRFRKEYLDILYPLLRFPERIILDNQSVMSGEEVFIR